MTAHKEMPPHVNEGASQLVDSRPGPYSLVRSAHPVNSIIILTPDQLTALVSDAVQLALTHVHPVAPSEILDTIGACELLSISRATLHRLRKEGLPFKYVGESPRFLRSALIEWVNSHSCPSSLPSRLVGADRGRI